MRGNADLTEAQKGDFIKWVAAVCNAQTETRSPQMAAMPPQDAGAPQIKWEAPEGWTEVPPSSDALRQFQRSGRKRRARSIFPLSRFPAMAASDADNVNRWRGQIGLAPVDASAVTSQVDSVENGGHNFLDD